MRWLEFRRQRKMTDRMSREARQVSRASAFAVEQLESRTLLNATLSSPINGVSSTTTVDLSQHFNDPLVPGTLVNIITPEGTIPVALTDAKTPKTVANFLSYITNGEYQGTIIHRDVPGFVIQGGGYDTSGNHIAQQAAVTSEAGAPNVTGTIAMALSTGPNSGTSEWFINLATNSQLDGTSVGGPFTVFGNVVYGGMTVVNAIAGLTVIDGSSVNGAWNTLPVQNGSGGTAPSNLVTNTYQVVSPLTYTATSDDPSIATATVNGSQLQVNVLNPSATTQIHVTATDVGSNTASGTFTVGPGQGVVSTSVTVGTKGVQVLRFRQADGTIGNVALSGGKGTAAVTLSGLNLVQLPGRDQVVFVRGAVNSISVAVTGASPTSALSIWGQHHSGIVHLTGITTDANMALLNAPLAALEGPLTETGAFNRVILGSASNGTITIGAGKVATLNVTTMNNEEIDSFIPIDTLKVDTWTGTATINVTSLNNVSIGHAFGGTINATRIQRFNAGSITAGNWTITGPVHEVKTNSISSLNFTSNSVALLRVNDSVTGSTFRTGSNIDNFQAGALTSSNVYVGADAATTGIPSSSATFVNTALLRNLKVNRFVNSIVGAQRIDALNLGAVQVSNNGIQFGLGTQRIKNLSLSVGKKRVHLHNVNSTDKITAAFTRNNITPQDFEAIIV